MGDILKSYVQKINELPTLPVTAHEILGLTSDPLLCIDQLKNIIESDPAISARILSVANSAFFGYRTRTTRLNDAIMRIGLNNVKSIAVGISIISFLDNGKKTDEYLRLFNHSVAVGLIARFIARTLKSGHAEDILTDGLLHDLGHLVLHRFFPDVYQEIIGAFEKGGPLLVAEKETLGYTHSDIGFWLADQWNLPDTIIDTNLYHHVPSLARKNEKQVAIIHIADYIASKNIFSPLEDDPEYPLDHCAYEMLALSDNDLKDIEESISNITFSDETFTMPQC